MIYIYSGYLIDCRFTKIAESLAAPGAAMEHWLFLRKGRRGDWATWSCFR